MPNIQNELSLLIDPNKNDLLGILGITEDLIESETRPGFVWVRMLDNLSEAILAYNRKVTPVFDLPVVLSFDGVKYEVQGIDANRYSDWVTGSAYLPKHGNQHSAMYGASGNDIVWVDQQQFLPLLPTPGGSFTGTNQVYVAPYVFKNSKGQWIYTGNTGVTVPPSTMATGSTMYLLYLRDGDGALYLKAGTPFAANITGAAGFMPYLPGGLTNNNDIPIVGVRRNGLNSGSPISWENILDVRQFYRGFLPAATGTMGYLETFKVYVSGTLIGDSNEIDFYGGYSGVQTGDRTKIYTRDTSPVINGDTTGFTDPENVVVTYDSSTRKITLTGNVSAYWRGVQIPILTSGWVSTAHPTGTESEYFLNYDGVNFNWSTSEPSPTNLQIALVFYGNTNKFALRQPQGMMPWQSREEFHRTIGIYKESGGNLSNYVLSSTTAADRRPYISQTSVHDEDIHTNVASLATGSAYTRFSLGATGTVTFDLNSADIINLTGSQPYYNSFSSPNWGQTLLGVGDYTCVWLAAVTSTADITSQKYRYFWVQGQQSGNLASQQALTTASLNLGNLTNKVNEFVFLARVIIRYIGGNWTIIQIDNLTGTHFSQTSTPAGNFLTSVTTDATLTGNGTAASPLSVVGGPGGGSIGVAPSNSILPTGTNITTLYFPSGTFGITGSNAYINPVLGIDPVDISSQITGSGQTHFTFSPAASKIMVGINGLIQKPSDITMDAGNLGFTLAFSPNVGDNFLVFRISNISVTDISAIHSNVASEISAITEKTTPAANDMFIIEDSADSNNKKMVKFSNVSTGSGDSTTTAAYASRPAAGNDGNIFYPSDGFSIQRDTSAAWVPWGPLFPMTQPAAASNWTWLNQGAASVADSKGGLYLSTTADTTGNNYHILHKAQPSKPYTITAMISTDISSIQYGNVGIGWLNSSSGSFVMFGLFFDGHLGATKYTNYSTFSAGYFTNYTPLLKQTHLFLRIADNNTSRICSVSFDGSNFLDLHTIGNTDFITADKVFFGVNSNNTYPTNATLLSWKEA